MNTHRGPLPVFDHGVTVAPDPLAQRGDWSDLLASRANGKRDIAQLTVYPDGRVLAVRSSRCKGSLDMAAWAGIVRSLGGPDSDYYAGVSLAPNPS